MEGREGCEEGGGKRGGGRGKKGGKGVEVKEARGHEGECPGHVREQKPKTGVKPCTQ